jgi:argininosuccinate synthase
MNRNESHVYLSKKNSQVKSDDATYSTDTNMCYKL